MKSFLTTLIAPALTSLLLVLPLMVLEWTNRQPYQEGFPFPLFAFLWLLPVVFLLLLQPVAALIRSGNTLQINSGILARVTVLALLAWIWVSVILDQKPCFLGLLNCD